MKKIIFIVLAVIFISCNNDFLENESLVSDDKIKVIMNNNNDEAIKEFYQIIGRAFKDENVKKEISALVEVVDPYSFGISFSFLYGNFEDITKHEKRVLAKNENLNFKNKSGKNVFREKINEIFSNTSHPNLDNYIDEKFGTKLKNRSIDSEIDVFILENNLQLSFPYKDKFDWENLEEFTVTIDELNLEEDFLDDDNYDFYYSGSKFVEDSIIDIDIINDDYLYENPTIAIVEKDDDYLGNYTRLTIGENEYLIDRDLPHEQIIAEYHDIWSNEGLTFTTPPPHTGGTSGSNSGNQNGNNPTANGNSEIDWGPAPQRVRVPQNINPYSFFPENYVLTVFMPKARIKGRAWKRSLSNSHRTRIQRVGGQITVNPNAGYVFGAGVYNFDFDVSRSSLKEHRWQNLQIMFDPNWHKAKGTQQLVFWTKRKSSSRKDVTVKNEVKLDAQGNYTPSTSQQVNIKAHSQAKAVFRGNVELDRDQILTTIVGGSESDNATYNYENMNLSIRRLSERFEFFFDFYYTDLSN